MIAALYVIKDGPYFNLDDIDAWDQSRDARLYIGPYPVIAHPPCQLWGKFAKINYKRWGGEHNRPGNDGGCFKHALEAVRSFGGVLEHPAYSYAWEEYNLVKPVFGYWQPTGNQGEWVTEVWQSDYGHLANKKTWLLFKSTKSLEPPHLIWEGKKGTHQIGFHDQRGKHKAKPTLSGKAASLTPDAFKEALIDMVKLYA